MSYDCREVRDDLYLSFILYLVCGPKFLNKLYNNLYKITATNKCTVTECGYEAQITYNEMNE